MIVKDYKRLINLILKSIEEEKEILQNAMQFELNEHGNVIDYERIIEVLKKSENIKIVDNIKNKKLAVVYNGNPEITLNLIFSAIKNECEIIFFAESFHSINNCLITLILECMKDCDLENKYIYYDESNKEIMLIQEQEKYDFIMFVGDYFEYKNLQHFIKKEIKYSNYGFFKGYIDKTKFLEEYKNILKFCYLKSIIFEVYENAKDFLEEVDSYDKVVIYTDSEEEKNKFKESLKTTDIIFNEFPFEKYKFDVNDLLVKL